MHPLDVLKRYDLVYIATPYTRYRLGIDKAFEDACAIAGVLINRGIKCFSPIAHSHSISKHGDVDPLNHGLWLESDEPFMAAADALVVVKFEGWDESYGVDYEHDMFRAADKPVHYLDPDTLELI